MPVKVRKWLPYVVIAEVAVVLVLLALLVIPKYPRPDSQETTIQTTEAETTLPEPSANVFTPMDFAYEGDYLTCLTDESIRGIDISTFQKEVDFRKVKEAGFEFVMIRLGYRGSVQGLLFEDEWAQRNYLEAKAAGLKVGGYFFSQSISVEEAIEEANYAMEIVEGWELEMPIVYDWEFISPEYRNAHVDARMLTNYTLAFCQTIEAAGYEAMVYFNPDQSSKRMYLQELTDYRFWLAMYTDEMDYPYKVDMWQYTSTGKVPGIQGNVDINLYFPYPRENPQDPDMFQDIEISQDMDVSRENIEE